jgi:hypothetical protein
MSQISFGDAEYASRRNKTCREASFTFTGYTLGYPNRGQQSGDADRCCVANEYELEACGVRDISGQVRKAPPSGSRPACARPSSRTRPNRSCIAVAGDPRFRSQLDADAVFMSYALELNY